MSGPLVAVLDYGIGNLRSAQKALQSVGADARLTDDPDVVSRADGVVLPGVGAFGRCVEALETSGLAEVAAGAARAAATQSDDYRVPSIDHMKSLQPIEALDLADIRNSLQSLMWRSMGVRREAKGLEEARQTIEHWCRYVLVRQFDTQNGWELQNLLTIARLMVAAASCRQESRGVHLRTDFPTADNAHWKQQVSFRHTATPLLESAVQAGQPQS